MIDFADKHFDLLSRRFGQRVGTGTASRLLNELAWSKGWPKDTPWIQSYTKWAFGW